MSLPLDGAAHQENIKHTRQLANTAASAGGATVGPDGSGRRDQARRGQATRTGSCEPWRRVGTGTRGWLTSKWPSGTPADWPRQSQCSLQMNTACAPPPDEKHLVTSEGRYVQTKSRIWELEGIIHCNAIVLHQEMPFLL